jgi:mannan endo-1,6-alpha-mannosidase
MEEQISASDIFSASLVSFNAVGPVTSTTGGNSTSNPNAGNNDSTTTTTQNVITTKDKAGAGILTVLFVVGWAGLIGWTVLGG